MKKKIFLLIFLLFFAFVSNVSADTEGVQCSSHIQYNGWLNYVKNGELCGITGQSKRLEAYIIKKDVDNVSGNILYRSYVQDSGWQDYVSNGNVSGTEGKGKRIEMIQIKLTDELSQKYDIYYRVHVQYFGWLDWAKNDEVTGTLNYNYRIEALQVKLVKKNSIQDNLNRKIFCEKPISIEYRSHVQSYGWLSTVSNGELSGTTGESKRLEAFIINNNSLLKGNILYRSYVEGFGWQDYVTVGNVSGTEGRSKKVEMIQIKLSDELSQKYDIYYRVHVQTFGWLDWAKNDQAAGTFGYRKGIEAIQIKMVKKGENAPGSNNNYYKENKVSVNYQSYYNNKWQNTVSDGAVSGTVGESIAIRGYKITCNNNLLNDWILYRSYISGKWTDYVTSNNISGGTNNNVIEAIQIKLSDEAIKYFDIYYRVHVQTFGWLDWTKNDEITGTLGYGKQIEALEIKILKKNDDSLITGNNNLIENTNYLTYRTHMQNYGWLNKVYDSTISGKVNENLRMEAIEVALNNLTTDGGIRYSSHVQYNGWMNWVYDGNVSGTVGEGKRMEAIKIELTGEIANLYDIYYRSYVEDFGWLDWAKNGEMSGSSSIGKKMEGIQIKLIEKGENAPGSVDVPYVDSIFKTINGKKYYYEKGVKVTGFKVIKGVKYFFNSEGVLIGTNVKRIIDVSLYQGNINWNSVKNDGVDGAIIRLGYGTSYANESCYFDSKFETNYNSTKELNLLSGIYLYSYAVDEVSARIEANFVVEKLKKYNVSKNISIYYDLEGNDWTNSLNASKYDKIISTFSNIVEKEGYKVKIYTYKYWAENKLSSSARGKLDWIAQYADYCTYNGTYKGWQYTSSGKVNGISGDVDISVWK